MRSRTITRNLLWVGCGLLIGAVVESRWHALGRLKCAVSQREQHRPKPCDGPTTRDPFCILVAGQSNAASHGRPRGRAGARSIALTPDGWFQPSDPWPGGTGTGGSVWTRLAPILIQENVAEEVVIACAAVGSSRVSDWAPDGSLFEKLQQFENSFDQQGVELDVIVWHQGETESWQPSSDADQYQRDLERIVRHWQQKFPQKPIVICTTTRDSSGTVNPGIRLAQHSVVESSETVMAGPDTDELGNGYRSDGVHFNERGLMAFAEGLAKVISQISSTRAETRQVRAHGS